MVRKTGAENRRQKMESICGAGFWNVCFTFSAVVMMVDRQTFDNDEGLRNVIRLEKVSDENISDLDTQHVVRGGPLQGVIIRPPLNGEIHV